MTLFFFLAALPTVLLAGAAVLVLDRLLGMEIDARTAETIRLLRRALEDEQRRVTVVVDRLATSERLEELLSSVDRDPTGFEELAAQGAAEGGLELLAIVAARGPEAGNILSSAHLPSAVGDPGPGFLATIGEGGVISGVTREYVAGNPPELAPVLLAARIVESPEKKAAVYLYGGFRLDGHRLVSLASMTQASLRLISPGVPDRTAGSDAQSVRTGAVTLAALRGGGATEVDTRIEIGIPSGRLETARRVFITLAGALLFASMVIALLAGTYLSRRITRPILELSIAARAVGRGDLEVRLAPQSDDEVGALIEVFNQMTAEIGDSREKLLRAERVAAWQQIARRVAHEIKNPLFPIQMTMETLRKSYKNRHEKLDEIVEESTRTVLEEVRALNRIVSEFSDFARLPAPQKAPVRPATILEHVRSLYGTEVDKKVIVAIDPDLPEVALDREQIERALINLVKNGLEAVALGGTVSVGAKMASHGGKLGLELEVKDDGPGMAPEVLSQIFTPYFTTKTEGTGLGLPIVERVVAEHGGRLDISSTIGRGTRFLIWLPTET